MRMHEVRALASPLSILALAACATGAAEDPQGKAGNGREVRMARLNYVELPVRDIAAARSFYERAFRWTMTEFGPTYAATLTGDTDVGLQGDAAEAPKAPLPVIEVPDLEAALAAVEGAGGRVVKPIFAFPGGRRFHFLDPSGNELAAVQSDSH
jgi:hypothetical protein